MKANVSHLKALIQAIFTATGSNATEAEDISEHLVRANLAGHDSHGVIRAPIYVQWLGEGKVNANQSVKILLENDGLALLDGQLGFGQAIGKQAVRLGIEKTRSTGCAVVALRNSAHLGRIGHWAELAAEADLVSLHFVNTSGLGMHVVPSGGIDRRLSINPVTMGVPVAGRDPLIFDIAAAATAEGKLKVARNKGVAVPEGWILDSEGRPTTDPNRFYGPPWGAILPFGGHKGYGLGFMAELLAGALTGGGCSQEGKTRLEQGMLSIYIDPNRLDDKHAFAAEVTRYVDFVKSSRPVPGSEVLVPGELEVRTRADRLARGIELDDTTWSQIVETARRLQLANGLLDAVRLESGEP